LAKNNGRWRSHPCATTLPLSWLSLPSPNFHLPSPNFLCQCASSSPPHASSSSGYQHLGYLSTVYWQKIFWRHPGKQTVLMTSPLNRKNAYIIVFFLQFYYIISCSHYTLNTLFGGAAPILRITALNSPSTIVSSKNAGNFFGGCEILGAY
jgi:hypothetical protein